MIIFVDMNVDFISLIRIHTYMMNVNIHNRKCIFLFSYMQEVCEIVYELIHSVKFYSKTNS